MSLKSGVGEGGRWNKGKVGGASPNVNRQKAPRAQWAWERPPKVISVNSGGWQRPGACGLARTATQRPMRMARKLSHSMLHCIRRHFFFFLPSTTKISIGLLAGCCGQLSHSWRKWSPLRDWRTLTRPESIELHKYTTPASPPQGCHPHSSTISSIQVSLLVLNVES